MERGRRKRARDLEKVLRSSLSRDISDSGCDVAALAQREREREREREEYKCSVGYDCVFINSSRLGEHSCATTNSIPPSYTYTHSVVLNNRYTYTPNTPLH